MVQDGDRCNYGDVVGRCSGGACFKTEECRNGVLDPDEQCDDGNAVSHDGCSSGCTVEVPAWRQIPDAWRPRRRAAAAFDANRGRVVLFGGVAPDRSDSTWELVHDAANTSEPDRWVEVFPAHKPSPRTDAAMAYDSARHVVVLFGGHDATGSSGETWEYDGSDWKLVATALSPPARGQAGMAYDANRGVTVLFGGRVTSTGAELDDTWEYNGTTWTPKTFVSPHPPGPTTVGMAYDSVRKVIVILTFGGSTNPTWEYAGGEWSNIVTAAIPPSRQSHSVVYDAARARVLLVGGYCVPNYDSCNDVWEYDGSNWQAGTAPPGGGGEHAIAFDSAHTRTVLVGGTAGPQLDLTAETRIFASNAWTTLAWSPNPAPRAYPVLAYDSQRAKPLLFGGQTDAGPFTTELWDLDHERWVQRDPVAIPSATSGIWNGAYDEKNSRMVVFGSCPAYIAGPCGYSATYALPAGSSSWIPIAGPQPFPRALAASAYDDLHGAFYLFGGQDSGHYAMHVGDTWRLDSTGWSVVATVGPAAREGAAMAYDDRRGRLVLFGGATGSGELDDTWEFDGTHWTEITPPDSPARRFGHVMSYDPIRQRVVLHGGATFDGERFEDLWEYDGTTWSLLPIAGVPPSGRAFHAVTYDRAQRRMLMVGGTLSWDTWSYRYESSWPDETCSAQSSTDADGDGFIGCADPDCALAPECP